MLLKSRLLHMLTHLQLGTVCTAAFLSFTGFTNEKDCIDVVTCLFYVSLVCDLLLSEGTNGDICALKGGALYEKLTPMEIQEMQKQAKGLQSQAVKLIRRASHDILPNCQVWGAHAFAVGLWVWFTISCNLATPWSCSCPFLV